MTTPASYPISVQGKEFVYSPGGTQTRFMVRGVAVDAAGVSCLGYPDVLADAHHAVFKSAILPQLEKLGVNCIRVYQILPQHSHALSMALLEKKGIYVMVGLATSDASIKQMTGEYSYGTFYHAALVVQEFTGYVNTFCFSVGNEVEFPGQQASNMWIAAGQPTTGLKALVAETVALELSVAQAMKSFARDIKAYISANALRSIPVGCAMQDGAQLSWNATNPNAYQQGLLGTDTIAQYYAAGHASERMDFIGINTYRYQSGDSPPNLSAYDLLAGECTSLPVPVFLTESGDIEGPSGPVARDWKIVPQMYKSKTLYEQLSGQVAFQLMEEGGGYGLYDVSESGTTVTLSESALGGATALASEFSKASALTLHAAKSTPVAPTTPPPKAGDVAPVSTAIQWPSGLLPSKTYQSPDTAITVENYAGSEILVTQLGMAMGTVAAGSISAPVSSTIQVLNGVMLSIYGQVNGSWDAVCGVAAQNVVAGITVKNDVAWGGYAGCHVELPQAITVHVHNASDKSVDVVVGETVVATSIPANTRQAVALTSLMSLNVQHVPANGGAPEQICSVSPLLLRDQVTIANTVAWGAGLGCNLPLSPEDAIVATFENSVSHQMSIVQGGVVLDTLAAGSASAPTTKQILLHQINDIYLQIKSDNWTTVCHVPAAALRDGMTIGNDVASYGDICVLAYG